VEKKTNPYGPASEKNSSTRSIQWALNEMGYNAGAIDGIYGWQTTAAVKRF
jgi:peptidoglycan hydrolase-like protein with peptidoglycan-binding domain